MANRKKTGDSSVPSQSRMWGGDLALTYSGVRGDVLVTCGSLLSRTVEPLCL